VRGPVFGPPLYIHTYIAQTEEVSEHLLGEPAENLENYRLGLSITGLRCGPSTSLIRNSDATHLIKTFGAKRLP
jgi:hypothetical protein